MGYNTVVVVMNDTVHTLADDASFGEKLANAINKYSCYREPVYVNSGMGSVAVVLGCEHADVTQVMALGNNQGESLGVCFGDFKGFDNRVRILKKLAEDHGYVLHKKPRNRK